MRINSYTKKRMMKLFPRGKATATSIQNWQKKKKKYRRGKEKKNGKRKSKRSFVCRDPTPNTKFRKRKVSKTVMGGGGWGVGGGGGGGGGGG